MYIHTYIYNICIYTCVLKYVYSDSVWASRNSVWVGRLTVRDFIGSVTSLGVWLHWEWVSWVWLLQLFLDGDSTVTHLLYSVLQCVAVCCSVLHCVAVCHSVSQCVAMCCSVLQRLVGVTDSVWVTHFESFCDSGVWFAWGDYESHECLIIIDHFPQKSHIISGSFAENGSYPRYRVV